MLSEASFGVHASGAQSHAALSQTKACVGKCHHTTYKDQCWSLCAVQRFVTLVLEFNVTEKVSQSHIMWQEQGGVTILCPMTFTVCQVMCVASAFMCHFQLCNSESVKLHCLCTDRHQQCIYMPSRHTRVWYWCSSSTVVLASLQYYSTGKAPPWCPAVARPPTDYWIYNSLGSEYAISHPRPHYYSIIKHRVYSHICPFYFPLPPKKSHE